jgi:ABC-type multidrug transport system ATPase subunit/ABC-type multidrug transport system permease subunit
MTTQQVGQGQPSLRVAYGGQTYEFADGPVVAGRDRAAELVIAHEDASRRHLEFRRSGVDWYVVDLGSTNGTYVDGRRISHERIAGRASIGVGGVNAARVDVELVAAPAPAAPPVPPTPLAQDLAPPAAPRQPVQQPPVQQPPVRQPPLRQRPPVHQRPPAHQQPAAYQDSQRGGYGPQQGYGGQGYAGQGYGGQQPAPSFDQPPAPPSYGGGNGPNSGGGSAPQAMPGRISHGHTVLPDNRPMGQVLTIGRTRANDVVLDDPLVSRQHATLELGRPAVLRDLNSFNGTFVNGQRLQGSIQLNPGDEVIFGNQTFMWDGVQMTARATRRDLTLFVENLTTVVKGGKRLLDGMSFNLEPSSLTAVIGPSGAGKSTLLGALTGLRPATHGNVVWQGHDLYTHYDQLRFQIGLVPQQDIQHPQLTVRQGLAYAAELRLPPDTSKPERDARVNHVVGQMQLERQVDNRIGTQLSGGQKKRVSIATELLTAPPLLFLDEPTSGLDPGLDRDVMHQLRTLSNEGRVVVVVTHSVLALDVCDNVVVLAPGGRLAYFGPPSGVLEHFGCRDYPEVFDVLDDPNLWQRIPPPRGNDGQMPVPNSPVAPPPHQSMARQLSTLTRRNLAVTFSDKLLLGMLLILPLALGGLSRVVQGEGGFDANKAGLSELLQRITILVVAAALMGTAVTIRELVKERPIFQREYAVGLSPDMYLLSKVMVLGTATFLQGILVTFLATVGQPGPEGGGVLNLGWFEIALAIAGLAFVMAVLGLTLSAVVSSSEQTMPILVGLVMVQLVLSGALVPVNARAGLEQLAWFAPSRWGYVASSVSMHLGPRIEGKEGHNDPLMAHTAGQWIANMAGMGILLVITLGLGFWLVRRSAVSKG